MCSKISKSAILGWKAALSVIAYAMPPCPLSVAYTTSPSGRRESFKGSGNCGSRSVGAESRPLSQNLTVLPAPPKGGAYCGSRSGPSFVQPLRLALLASSPSRGAFGKEVSSQRNGELAGLSATPEPPLLGEVALRSNDGEVGQSRALSGICVGSPFGGNDDDRGLRPKQGGVVGAAASKTQVPPKARSGCWVPQPGAGKTVRF